MISTENLKFDANGLIPAIITDEKSGKVLMMAYMSRESLDISTREGRACFWSRSRQELWRKGETSGNVQHIVSIKADCDSDTLLVRVNADGPACHTGAETCFNDYLWGEDEDTFSLDTLYELVTDRKVNAKPGSYTTYLFEKGVDKILKKIGEESTEVVIAGKAGDRAETVFELADLCYHALVLMAELGITPDEVRSELKSRHVVDKKVKQEKMT